MKNFLYAFFWDFLKILDDFWDFWDPSWKLNKPSDSRIGHIWNIFSLLMTTSAIINFCIETIPQEFWFLIFVCIKWMFWSKLNGNWMFLNRFLVFSRHKHHQNENSKEIHSKIKSKMSEFSGIIFAIEVSPCYKPYADFFSITHIK